MQTFGFNHVTFLVYATQWTVMLSLIAFVGGSLIGGIAALMRVSTLRWMRIISAVYINAVQSTPLLMQLFLIFFGLSMLGYRMPPIFAAGIAMSLNSGAFLGEIWRGAIQSIAKTQWEAGASLNMTRFQQLGYIIIPQAVMISLPPTIGFSVQIIKSTSLASIIGFVDVIRTAQNINNATFQPLLVFTVVGLIYFSLCTPLTLWSRKLERSLDVGR